MTRSPTPAPVTKLVMPVTKVRTGRPLLGQVAMTAAERQRRRRAALKSGEAAGRKKEPVAAHPQKSNRAIAAETEVAFKTVPRALASGVLNDTPEKTIGLDGKSHSEGRPKIRIPNNWAPRDYQMNVWRYLERGGKRAICVCHRRAGRDDVCLHWAAASLIDKPATYWHMLPAYSQGRKAIW